MKTKQEKIDAHQLVIDQALDAVLMAMGAIDTIHRTEDVGNGYRISQEQSEQCMAISDIIHAFKGHLTEFGGGVTSEQLTLIEECVGLADGSRRLEEEPWQEASF